MDLRTFLVCLLLSGHGFGQTLVINELDPDQSGSDDAEFVELFDGGTGLVPLDGWVLVFYNGSSDSVYRVVDLSGHTTNAQGYFVVGNPGVSNVTIEIAPGSTGAFQNGPDAIALYQGNAEDFANGDPVTTEGLVDAVVYGTDDPDDFELLDALTPGELQVDDTREESMSSLPDGGDPFDSARFALQAPTPGFANEIIESLTVTLSMAAVSEGAGAAGLQVTVARSGSTTSEVEVSLSLDDFTEASVPETLTLAVGESEGAVSVDLVDDAWPDGDQAVSILAKAPGYMDGTATVTVLDDGNDALTLAINEIYADDRDDANGDEEGALDGPGLDEFVELLNVTDATLDLSGHALRDAVAERHVFPEGTVVDPGCAIVVFGGGGVDEGNNPLFGGATVQKANGSNEFGLSLNNAGDTVRVMNPEGLEVIGFRYESATDASWVRQPDGDGAFVSHLDAGGLFLSSPGYTIDGEPFCARELTLSASIDPLMIREDAGTAVSVLTISRSGPTAAPLILTLANGDPSEIAIPLTVEIPAGEASVTVPIDAVNDRAEDGDIVVTITISAPDYLNGSAQIQVLDDGDPPAVLVINELDSDQPSPEDFEFVEIYDGGVGGLPLDGFVLVLFNGNNGQSYAAYDLAGQSTNADGYFVLGDAEVANVSLAVPSFTLQNGPDAVALYRAFRSDFPNGSFPFEQGLVDAVVYGTEDEDAVDLLDVLTPDQPQVNEGVSNNTDSIGRQSDGGDPFQSSGYTTQFPSPGAANGSVRPTESGYANWAAAFQSAIGDPDDDPDDDGLANGLEYALSTDPEVASNLPLRGACDGEAFVYHLPFGGEGIPDDVVLVYEGSYDLENWAVLEPSETAIEEDEQQVRFEDFLTDEAPGFIRLGVRIQP